MSVNRNLTRTLKVTVDCCKQTLVEFHPDTKRGHYIMDVKFYGVDVSKDKLDVGCDGQVVQIENTERARSSLSCGRCLRGALWHWRRQTPITWQMADICYSFGMRVFVINPG